MEETKKTCKSRRETAVQGTNDSSIVSKCSMAQLGYFADEYLREFVSKLTRRAPLIHRGYYIRAKAIDHILKKFLSETSGQKQVISLGAGFDSAYFRLTAEKLLHGTAFVEVDYPEVVKRKHALIRRSETLASLIPGLDTPGEISNPLIEINTAEYKLLGADLTQLNTLEALLKLCGVDLDIPTLLLSECVLTYMTRRCSTAVIQWAAETFADAVFVLYEQINPDDAFGLVMQNHFQVIGSPLKCINSYPTLKSQIDRFKSAGWSRCQAMDMNQFYQTIIDGAERQRIENLEPFDEYEEWNLKCAHYMVICGYNTDREFLIKEPQQNIWKEKRSGTAGVSVDFLDGSGDIQRFGHSSMSILLPEFWMNNSAQLEAHNSFNIQSGINNSSSDIQLGASNFSNEIQLTASDSTSDILSGADNSSSNILSGVDNSSSDILSGAGNIYVERNKNSTGIMSIVKDNVRSNCVEQSTSNRKISVEDNRTGIKEVNSLRNPEDMHMSSNIFIFGGFGEKDGKHRRLVDIAVLDAPTFRTFTLYPNVNPKEIEVSRMHDQACPLPDGSVILIGGRTSPIKLCTQLLKIEFLRDFPAGTDFKMNLSKDEIQGTSEYYISNKEKNETQSNHMENMKNLHESSCKISEQNCDQMLVMSDRNNSENKGGNSRQLSYVICTVLEQKGNVPCPRWRHTATPIKINGKDFIFLYGGRTDKQLALDDAYILDVTSMTWSKIAEPAKADIHPGKRHTHTATWWQDSVIIAGGLNEDQVPINSIFMFHFPTNEWTQILATPDTLSRYSHTAHVVHDTLILIGGVNTSHCPPGVAVVNLKTFSSIELSLPAAEKSKLYMLHRHTSCYLRNEKFLVIGGGGNCFSFGTHLNKSPFVLSIDKSYILR